MDKISYAEETLKRPFIWFLIVISILDLMILNMGQEINEKYDIQFVHAVVILFGFALLHENHKSIIRLKSKTGKKLGL